MILTVAAMLLSGCAARGLSFVQDERLTILEPNTNASVALPFEVRWSVTDLDVTFAVFFDRSPMRPGQALLAVVPEDDPCRSDPSCPDKAWLADHDIYLTKNTVVAVERLPDLREGERGKDRHDVTIVLLDEGRRRIGESAFTREFVVERDR